MQKTSLRKVFIWIDAEEVFELVFLLDWAAFFDETKFRNFGLKF